MTHAASASKANILTRLKSWQPPPDISVMPPFSMLMVTTLPIAPSSIIFRACQYSGKLRSRSPAASFMPRSRHASTMRSASDRTAAMGFSHPMALTSDSAHPSTTSGFALTGRMGAAMSMRSRRSIFL